MKRTSRVGNCLRSLALGALSLAGVAASAAPARADACFGGGHEPGPRDAAGQDAGGQDAAGQSDGATLGFRLSGPRRRAGVGLVLAAGLGVAWLGSRRKSGDGGGDDRGAPLT